MGGTCFPFSFRVMGPLGRGQESKQFLCKVQGKKYVFKELLFQTTVGFHAVKKKCSSGILETKEGTFSSLERVYLVPEKEGVVGPGAKAQNW